MNYVKIDFKSEDEHGFCDLIVIKEYWGYKKGAKIAKFHKGAIVERCAIVGQGARVGRDAIVGQGAIVGQYARVERGARVGRDARVERGAIVGRDARVEQGAIVGQGAIVERCAIVGQGARVGQYARVGQGAIVLSIVGLYKYTSSMFYCINKKDYMIQMGCHTRYSKDWFKDFWNNEKEFPNDGSEKSLRRLICFNEHRRRIKVDAVKNDRLTQELQEFLDWEIDFKVEEV